MWRLGSVLAAHRLSCSAACGIFWDQGSNPCPLLWQASSYPLCHWRSAPSIFNTAGSSTPRTCHIKYWPLLKRPPGVAVPPARSPLCCDRVSFSRDVWLCWSHFAVGLFIFCLPAPQHLNSMRGRKDSCFASGCLPSSQTVSAHRRPSKYLYQEVVCPPHPLSFYFNPYFFLYQLYYL